jgi:hypothetical protein
MRPSQKLALVDSIAHELGRRFSFTDIDTYLNEFDISTPHSFNDYDSAAEYSKASLRSIPADLLLKIADDLEIHPDLARRYTPPRNWPDLSKFRLFISHLAAEKEKGTRLRDCLAPYNIAGFVAHQDIHPTAEWQIEIERALTTMDAFLAIHTTGFARSFWTQQEIGFAYARGVKIISLRFGEDPTGFISNKQALPRLDRTAEQIASEISTLLSDDPLTSSRLNDVLAANLPTKSFDSMDDEIPF